MRKVAALFVQKGGIYSQLEGVDPWDIERDARTYTGLSPVVAHPPCQLWVNFAALNYKRWGGEHNRPGNDGGCFEAALTWVQTWGGVLEHPASSNAWPTFGLTRPSGVGWSRCHYSDILFHGQAAGMSAWVCEVWQSAYGHPARKKTWLYYAGFEPPFELRWDRLPGTHQVGWFDRIKPTLGKKAASATPPAFAEELVRLARHSRS